MKQQFLEFSKIQKLLLERGREDLVGNVLLAQALLDEFRDKSVGKVRYPAENEPSLGEAYSQFQEIHRLLQGGGRLDLVGDVLFAQSLIRESQGDDMGRDLCAVEAAAAFCEHGRWDAAKGALALANP